MIFSAEIHSRLSRMPSPTLTIFNNVVQNANDALFLRIQRQHYPEGMQNVGIATLIQLPRMRLNGDL